MKRVFALLLCSLLLAGCSAPGSRVAVSADSAAPSAVASSVAAQPEGIQQPLTGIYGEAAVQRPTAVIVRNTPEAAARQWGTADASVLIEALTEGKSTNWMLWYDSISAVPKVGPVGEGKDIFWQFALPENSILAQKGANVYAQNLLNCYAYQPLDAMALGVNAFDFDASDLAAADENCWFTQGATLQNGLAAYGLSADGTVPLWQNFSDTPSASATAASTVSIGYSDQNGTMLRYENGAYGLYRADGTPHIDVNTGAQPAFQNVLVLYASAGVKDDRYTRDYDLTGGQGIYLVGGTAQIIRWEKGDAASPLKLYAEDGTALNLARGKTYMGIVGGFGGQSVSVTDSTGAAVLTELTFPAPIAPAQAPADVPADVPPADSAAASAAAVPAV